MNRLDFETVVKAFCGSRLVTRERPDTTIETLGVVDNYNNPYAKITSHGYDQIWFYGHFDRGGNVIRVHLHSHAMDRGAEKEVFEAMDSLFELMSAPNVGS